MTSITIVRNQLQQHSWKILDTQIKQNVSQNIAAQHMRIKNKVWLSPKVKKKIAWSNKKKQKHNPLSTSWPLKNFFFIYRPQVDISHHTRIDHTCMCPKPSLFTNYMNVFEHHSPLVTTLLTDGAANMNGEIPCADRKARWIHSLKANHWDAAGASPVGTDPTASSFYA